MKKITVFGRFTPSGFALSSMSSAGGIGENTINTVCLALRGTHIDNNVLIFDEGAWDEKVWG